MSLKTYIDDKAKSLLTILGVFGSLIIIRFFIENLLPDTNLKNPPKLVTLSILLGAAIIYRWIEMILVPSSKRERPSRIRKDTRSLPSYQLPEWRYLPHDKTELVSDLKYLWHTLIPVDWLPRFLFLLFAFLAVFKP